MSQSGPGNEVPALRLFRSAAMKRYAVAFLSVALALAIRLALNPFLQESFPLVTFFAAVTVAAWYGGLGPGIAATVLSLAAGYYVMIEPRFSFSPNNAGDALRLVLFLGAGILVSVLSDRLRAANKRLKQSELRLRSLLESCPIGIVVGDVSGRNTGGLSFVNGNFLKIIGYTRAQFEERQSRWDSITPREMLPADEEALAKVGRHDVAGPYEKVFIHSDGHQVPVLVALAPTPEAREAIAFVLDLTERKRSEAALRHSEELFRLTLESADVGVWKADLATGEFEASPIARRMHGIPPNEALTDAVARSAVHPDDRSRLDATIRSAFAHGAPLFSQHRVLWPDGTLRWLQSQARPVTDPATGTVQMFGVVQDITDRKLAEDQRRAAEEKFAAAFYSNPCASAIVDLGSGRLLEVNDRFEEFTGYRRDEAVGRKWAEVRPWEDPRLQQEALGLLAKQGSVRSLEFRFRKRDGETRDGLWSATVMDLNGRLCGISTVVDISNLKQAELTLRQNEERYRTVADFTYDWEYWESPDGKSIYVSPSCQRISGYSSEQFLSDASFLGSIVHPDDREVYARHQRDSLVLDRPPGLMELEFRIVHRDGSTRWIGHGCQDVLGSGGEWLGRRASNRDITERKRTEAALQMSEEKLRQSQKLESIGRLAGGVAHDFNNLLTVINGYAAFLSTQLSVRDPLREYALEIGKAGERAANLTSQLLAFGRKQVIRPSALDLNSVVLDTERMLRRLIGDDIELLTILDPHLGPVMADPAQIHQVILNLAINARDAMPDGGDLEIATANIELDSAAAATNSDAAPGRYVLLTITDTGIGMTREVLRNLFEPFFTTKEQGKGTGLGLATVYGIVRQSGGWIDVQSAIGQGSSFRIYLPRIEASLLPRPAGQATTDAPCGDETVLVVEDQEAVRRLASTILRGHGYRVLEAANGAAAYLLANEHQGEIHLLLTDVVMPGMKGDHLSERLLKLRPNLKVLLMSGYSEDVLAHRGALDDRLVYIQKPFAPDQLAAKVREVLDRPAAP